MEKIFLSTSDFQNTGRSINFAGISNANTISSEKFEQLTKSYNTYAENEINDFILKAAEVKSLAPKFFEELKKRVSNFRKVTVEEGSGQHKNIFLENQCADDGDLQKALDLNVLDYESGLKIKKTGGEIIEKCNQILLSVLSDLTDNSKKLEKIFLQICEVSDLRPTEDIGIYETRKLNKEDIVGLKMFESHLCYFDDVNNARTFSDYPQRESSKVNSKIEANLCRQYNEYVRELLDCKAQKNTIETLMRNLDKDKSYELNLETLRTLNF